jgi:hypothetical protein
VTIVELVVLALATGRLANLLADDSQGGPFQILWKFREWAGVRYSRDGVVSHTNSLSELILCVFCNSIWIGLFIAMLYLVSDGVAFYFSLPFALSWAAIITRR